MEFEILKLDKMYRKLLQIYSGVTTIGAGGAVAPPLFDE